MAHKRMALTGKGADLYRTRMMRAGEPVTLSGPKARLFEALGYVEEAPHRARRPQLDHDGNGKEGGAPKPAGDLGALRAEYQAKYGKRPFNGWSADTLREKIADA
jgi:hypothetical protein